MKKAKQSDLRIGIIGNGNLASHLIEMLISSKQKPVAIYNRKTTKVLKSNKNSISTSSSLKTFASQCDIVFICVSDSGVSSICKKLIPFVNNKLLIHCSGSLPLKEIPKGKHNRAVVYPLMTFTKGDKIKYNEIPFLIEAEDIEQLTIIRNILSRISSRIYLMNSEQRKKVHLSAVIASNFSNHVIELSQLYLHKNGILSEDLLKPLMKQTIRKAFKLGAHTAQTGPAKRGDKNILQEHLKMLKSEKELALIYKTISESIIKLHNE